MVGLKEAIRIIAFPRLFCDQAESPALTFQMPSLWKVLRPKLPRRSVGSMNEKPTAAASPGRCPGCRWCGQESRDPAALDCRYWQWIKEGKLAVSWTRLSGHWFRGNEVRLWLSVIAYNLGNLWRRLALPRRVRNWSLTSLQQRLHFTCLIPTISASASRWLWATPSRGTTSQRRH